MDIQQLSPTWAERSAVGAADSISPGGGSRLGTGTHEIAKQPPLRERTRGDQLNEIPDEMNLLWIARFLGEPSSQIYKLNKEGKGPIAKKSGRTYVVRKASFLSWLATRER